MFAAISNIKMVQDMLNSDEGNRGELQRVVITVIVLTLTVVYLALLIRRNGYASRLPPGPRGWPFTGSLLSLGKLPHRSFAELSKKYGPLMFLRLGSVPTLVVSSPDMAKEIFKTHDQIMASRPEMAIINLFSYGHKAIVFTPYGPQWRRGRKICMLELFSVSRINQFKGVRYGESLAMLQSILEASAQGNALNMKKILSNLTLNIMTQILWNKRESTGKPSAFLEIIHEIFYLSGAVNIADYIPVLKPLNLQGYDQRAKNAHERMDLFIENIIDDHWKRDSSIAADDPNVKEDFVDVLLKLSLKQAESEPLYIDVVTVKAILADMICAGTETSSTTLEWVLAELVKHPKTITRAQDELDSVVGRDRLVNEADVPNLKYLQAVVKETLRMHPPVPLLMHKSTHDCEIAGYHVPASTLVFVNVWAMQRDAAVWERPLEFDPDRFLNSTVDVKGKDFELVPFGSGRRICAGMNLALAVVQLSIAQLLHAFTWTLPPDQKPVDLDMTECVGITSPKEVPLMVLAKSRLPIHIIDPAFS